MPLAAVGLVLVALSLSGCGHHNTDPRNGRVTLDESNCAVGSCYWDWETCQGSNLVIHIDSDEVRDRTIVNSSECRP